MSSMPILITCLFLFLAALALAVIRVIQPNARYGWMVASGGVFLALISAGAWLAQIPFESAPLTWQPLSLFREPVSFRADGIAWALAISILCVAVSVILTGIARQDDFGTASWIGTLTLSGMGILALTSNNPLTLLLVWSLIDISDLIAQLVSADGEKNNERVVISFSARVLGNMVLLWVYVSNQDFGNSLTLSGFYLSLIASLRLGILPLNVSPAKDASYRRGFGTVLVLIGAISSFGLLSRAQISTNVFTPFLGILVAGAGAFGGWGWLRAPDALSGRPYWMISFGSLAILSALGNNPIGAAAWGCAMALAGAPLFLFSIQDNRLSRILLAGILALASLPFTLTASAWNNTPAYLLILGTPTQIMLLAGTIRQTLKNLGDDSISNQPRWTRIVYPIGICLPLFFLIFLGLIGWDGALQTGNIIQSVTASILTGALVWSYRRFRIFNPSRSQSVSSNQVVTSQLYQWIWSAYLALARFGKTVTQALEGEGGMMWTLLFLVLFISIITQGR